MIYKGDGLIECKAGLCNNNAANNDCFLPLVCCVVLLLVVCLFSYDNIGKGREEGGLEAID